MTNKVIIFGNAEISVVNHFYLTHDSPYEVVAFTVDESYIREDTLCGLPVVPFENVETLYSPTDHQMSIVLGIRDVNHLRAKKYAEGKKKGYRYINYVSSKAITWPGLNIGDNTYIFENTIVQPFAKIGSNVFVSTGCLVGHNSELKDHCFVSAGVTVLGNVSVGPYCVLGANATVLDGIAVGEECIVGAGALITKNTSNGSVYIGPQAERLSRSSKELAPLLTWSRDARQLGPGDD